MRIDSEIQVNQVGFTETRTPEKWDLIIEPEAQWWNIHLRDIWSYRDLLWLFVWRDFVSVYKQTVLGPLWFFIQPLLTTLVFTAIFSGVANMPTDGVPAMLFYLAGTTPWNYFSTCLNKTSNVFIANSAVFGKVYFPRLIVPLSIVTSNMVQFGIQFLLFMGFFVYYLAKGTLLHPNWVGIAILTPLLLMLMAGLGLGMGIIISSLTTKYRDLSFLVGFGVQLMMYATPVIYSISSLPPKYRMIILVNPMSSLIETFRSIYLGGPIPWFYLNISLVTTSVLLLIGVLIFNRIEKSFVDVV